MGDFGRSHDNAPDVEHNHGVIGVGAECGYCRATRLEAELTRLRAELEAVRGKATMSDRGCVQFICEHHGDGYGFVDYEKGAEIISAHVAASVAPYRNALKSLIDGIDDMGSEASAFLIVMKERHRQLLTPTEEGQDDN